MHRKPECSSYGKYVRVCVVLYFVSAQIGYCKKRYSKPSFIVGSRGVGCSVVGKTRGYKLIREKTGLYESALFSNSLLLCNQD